jgi:transcription antitermination factor NusG
MGAFVNERTHLSENGEAMPMISASTMNIIPGATGIVSAANWYAVQTVPRHEKKLREDLRLRSLEHFLPVYEALHRWKNGCKVRVELPLFPGYLFVKIDPRERFKVLSLTGAISIVGSPSGPWALPEEEVTSLRASVAARKLTPHPFLPVGQKVRVKSGPLANLTGILVRNDNGLRVVLSVELIRQSASVEVDADEVEPVAPANQKLIA